MKIKQVTFVNKEILKVPLVFDDLFIQYKHVTIFVDECSELMNYVIDTLFFKVKPKLSF